MSKEVCLVLIKPDGLLKSVTGNVINELSAAHLKIIGAKNGSSKPHAYALCIACAAYYVSKIQIVLNATEVFQFEVTK